ncbi:MAG: ABC transporter ATP-binding protein [Synergistaceae bacterium]|jgi:ABC-type Fe3+/spermidine/putrescine transport system ATPase subunit|nr:ABC transporter ATP-binding protein [Synergistaceae bacterium]
MNGWKNGVELIAVSKLYGNTYAVRDVSLAVREGEFLSVVGPSGCGKTTMLRMISGFAVPDSGEVRIGGEPMKGVPVRERRVGIVFQNYALFPNMTAYENVAFGMEAQNWPKARIENKAAELLEMVGMGDRAGAYPRQLSGGQQQRVALARALAIEPRVLLLDEPLSALDAKVRNTLRFEIKRIQRDSGITTVYVTHDQEEALSISDRVALMRGGMLEQVGTPAELYAAPVSEFAADFIGVNNILRGTYLGEGRFAWNGRVFVVEAQRESRQATPRGTAPGPAAMTVRPERLVPAGLDLKDRRVDPFNVLEGKVVGKVFLGPLTRVALSVDGEMLLMDILSAAGEPLNVGDPLKAYFDASDAHLL